MVGFLLGDRLKWTFFCCCGCCSLGVVVTPMDELGYTGRR